MSCCEYLRKCFEAFFISPSVEVGMGAGTAYMRETYLSSPYETGKFFLWVSWLVSALFHTIKKSSVRG